MEEGLEPTTVGFEAFPLVNGLVPVLQPRYEGRVRGRIDG